MPKLVDCALINPKFDKALASKGELASFVPMAAVSAETGSIVEHEVREIDGLLKGFTPFQPEDVLVAKITPCFENGKIAHANIERRFGFGSTEFHVVRADTQKLDERYLFHFLRQPRIRVEGEKRMTGSGGQRRVPKAYLEQLDIPLPTLSDQRRIADVLDKADALRAKRREAIAKLDQLLHAVFLEMFGDPVFNPKKWPVVRVGDQFSDFVGGKNMECPDTSASPYRILKVSAVTKTVYAPNESKAAPEHYEPSQNAIVRKGDLLFSRANTSELVAATAYVWDTPANMVLPDKIWRMVKTDEAIVEDLFAWELFKNRSFRSELTKRSSGTSGSMKNIAKGKLVEVLMPLPPKELQNRFAKFSESLHRQKHGLIEQFAKLEIANTSLALKFFGN
ncbi:hypothetical protein G7047_28265 [Diaphorobacter sp. HDW4A]|uniref:restriction endonuclease subunit S n=1 Tax=Diaphorobacter sp. HDW4A TaxID=2714924 RepID=UPI0014079889|nr:restriction endonuclease subunit S [Diaphorobacter sp. HDW4A]QIL83407.1 hypothetical protein G7047_28265 [Diaphorobacter sp. HDW4A]